MGPEHRDKIANSNVLRDLIKFAEGKTKPEDFPPHRVTAALGLLDRIMPKLATTEVLGSEEDGSVGIVFKTIVEK
jgi:hypothetical protein